MTWKRTIEDGRRVFRAERYEIVELYEPFDDQYFQLNCDGYFKGTSRTIAEAKTMAQLHKQYGY